MAKLIKTKLSQSINQSSDRPIDKAINFFKIKNFFVGKNNFFFFTKILKRSDVSKHRMKRESQKTGQIMQCNQSINDQPAAS
jgi:hypothetical protein